MFDFIRSHKRLMIFVLVLFLIPGMVLFGAHVFIRSIDRSGVMLKVGKEVLTKQKFDFFLKDNLEQIKQNLGNEFDDSAENVSEIRKFFLKKIIDDLILSNYVRKQDLTVSDIVVSNTIKSLPIFASLHKENGLFDIHGYRLILTKQGISPKQFDKHVRLSATKNRLIDSLLSSTINSEKVSEYLTSKIKSKYKIQKMLFPLDKFRPHIDPDDNVLQAFYTENKLLFQRSQQAEIEYIYLDANKLKIAEPKEQEIKNYYLTNIKKFTIPKAIRASHILIKVNSEATDKDKKVAKAKAEFLLTELRKDPKKFAFLAKRYSDDVASANDGGDLGYFSQGSMLESFEKVAFSLKKNEISNVIESEFGYHIILIKDVRSESIKSFDEVKNKVRIKFLKTIRAENFLKKKKEISDYIQGNEPSIKDLAKKMGLNVSRSLVAKNDHFLLSNKSLSEKDDFLRNPKLISAVFSSVNREVNQNKILNVIIDSERLVLIRLLNYLPAYIPEYKEVVADVKIAWFHQQAKNLAEKESQIILDELRKAHTFTSSEAQKNNYFFEPVTYMDLQRSGGVSIDEKRAIMSVTNEDVKGGSVYVRAKTLDGGFVIYRVLSVSLEKSSGKLASSALSREIKSALAQSELEAFINELKNNTQIKYYN